MYSQEIFSMFVQFQSPTRVGIIKQLHQKQPLQKAQNNDTAEE